MHRHSPLRMLSRASSSKLGKKVTGYLKRSSQTTQRSRARFQAVLRRNYITLGEQSEDIATLTRFIGVIRRALTVKGDANWVETLKEVIARHNKSPHRKLFETVKRSASEVPGDAESNGRKRKVASCPWLPCALKSEEAQPPGVCIDLGWSPSHKGLRR